MGNDMDSLVLFKLVCFDFFSTYMGSSVIEIPSSTFIKEMRVLYDSLKHSYKEYSEVHFLGPWFGDYC